MAALVRSHASLHRKREMTMKLKTVLMLQSAATQQVSLPKGRKVRLPEAIADDFIRGGLAVLVNEGEELKKTAAQREKRTNKKA